MRVLRPLAAIPAKEPLSLDTLVPAGRPWCDRHPGSADDARSIAHRRGCQANQFPWIVGSDRVIAPCGGGDGHRHPGN